MTLMQAKRPEGFVNVHERLFYKVYEGDKVVATGETEGHSFTTLGKYRLARMLGGLDDAADVKLDRYRVMRSGPSYDLSTVTKISWDSTGGEGLITTETEEFTTAGIYLRLEGSQSNDNVNSYYHYVTTEVTIGTGQSVKFYVEYTFTGLGSEGGGGYGTQTSGHVNCKGDSVLAALLINEGTGTLNIPFNYIEMELGIDGLGRYSSGPIVVSVSSNGYLLCSGEQWALDDGGNIKYIRAVTSHIGGVRHCIHEWGHADEGDSSGPFEIDNATGSQITVQTDIAFSF